MVAIDCVEDITQRRTRLVHLGVGGNLCDWRHVHTVGIVPKVGCFVVSLFEFVSVACNDEFDFNPSARRNMHIPADSGTITVNVQPTQRVSKSSTGAEGSNFHVLADVSG